MSDQRAPAPSRSRSVAERCQHEWHRGDGVVADDIAAYVAVRSEFLHHEPAFMLGVISGLVRPEFKVEIEVIALRPAAEG